ncbi:MAG TPA: sigma-70 family RNA polymerase sigma factor [Phycisphaerae bacterium]|nr:sigma-70 family RNA polymerase sigma factor [Phycisphaerae bacterium]
MLHVSQTTSALVAALQCSRDEDAWRELDRRYRPVMVAIGVRLGLTHADAEDAAQETLARVAVALRDRRFDRQRGRLRTWILQIARNCISDARRRRTARREHRGESAFEDVALPEALDAAWEEECRRAVVERALDELRSATDFDARTIEAFERVGLAGRPAAEVADELGLSVDSVYAAKSRCTRVLREIVTRLSEAYEVPPPD